MTRPPKGRKRWSARSMGRHVGISHSTVQRIWWKNELKPHITRTFKLSNDPKFEEKFWDVIGLYLDPPATALVLCCDEKSQCQAHPARAAARAEAAAHDDARLHTPRHGHIVRSAQRAGGQTVRGSCRRARRRGRLSADQCHEAHWPAGKSGHAIESMRARGPVPRPCRRKNAHSSQARHPNAEAGPSWVHSRS